MIVTMTTVMVFLIMTTVDDDNIDDHNTHHNTHDNSDDNHDDDDEIIDNDNDEIK